jgi:hypothetical protein
LSLLETESGRVVLEDRINNEAEERQMQSDRQLTRSSFRENNTKANNRAINLTQLTSSRARRSKLLWKAESLTSCQAQELRQGLRNSATQGRDVDFVIKLHCYRLSHDLFRHRFMQFSLSGFARSILDAVRSASRHPPLRSGSAGNKKKSQSRLFT